MVISTVEVAEHYGIEINHNGMALCPFHNDRHPSLFVADNHYYCFGCGEHGDSMQEVVDLLADEYGWSDSVSNLSNKLQRESLRYPEAIQLADVLGYEIVWKKRGDR